MKSTTQKIRDILSTMKIGDTFTVPQLRKEYFPNEPYATVFSAISYLHSLGNLKKTNTWNGYNNVIWEIVTNSFAPSVRTVSWPKKVVTKKKKVPEYKLETKLMKAIEKLSATKLSDVSTQELLQELGRRHTK